MKRYIPLILWMAVIFILSSIPGTKFSESPFPGSDKLVHLVEYFVLGFLCAKALRKKVVLLLLLGIIYGVLDEIHQIYVPYREFSVLDMLVDGVGVTLGVLWRLLLRR